MKGEASYQKDTIKVVGPLINLQGLQEPGKLNIGQTTAVPLKPIPTREFLRKDTDSVQSQPAPPSREQLRYWWWLRENKLLVDSSRYMQPRSEVLTNSYAGVEATGVHLPERPVRKASNDWLILLILLAVVLFASVRTSWTKYLGRLFYSVVNQSISYRLFQEKNSSLLFGAFQLDIIFYLVFSVFVFQMIKFFRLEFFSQNFFLFLMSLVFVVSYFLLKRAIYRFTGFVVEKQVETEEFLFNMSNFNRITGMMLLPVVTLIAFSPFRNTEILIISGVFMVISLYFLLIMRGFITLLKKQFSIFYLFLYFCTLEILPLVLLYKVLVV